MFVGKGLEVIVKFQKAFGPTLMNSSFLAVTLDVDVCEQIFVLR